MPALVDTVWANNSWSSDAWAANTWAELGAAVFYSGLGGGNLSSPRLYSRLSEVYDSGANRLSRWVPTS